MWVDAALEKIGGKVEDRDAFIDTVLKTELTGSPLGKTVKLDAYGNPIYDVYDPQGREARRRQILERADHHLSECLAILDLRSRDLHEAAALFADLPRHQEEPDRLPLSGTAV